MTDRHAERRYPPQVWFVAVMVLALVTVVASIALGMSPASATDVATRIVLSPEGPARSSPTSSQASGSTDGQAEGAGRPSQVPALVGAASRETPSPTPTLGVPSPTPTAQPTPPREDHYWLRRPVGPNASDVVARTYPYASRGDGSYPIHHGVELVNPLGTPVLAAASGIIRVAGTDEFVSYGARVGFYGRLVIQELDDKYLGHAVYVLYGHLSRIDVGEGQHVEAGEIIGLVGMSGVAVGPHLHLEVRYRDNDYMATVNPELWLKPRAGMGTLAGLVATPDGQPIPEAVLVLYAASAPDRPVREIVTYPAREVNPDPGWGENLATGDLPAGEWVLKLYHGQTLYTAEVTVEPGRTSWAQITVSG